MSKKKLSERFRRHADHLPQAVLKEAFSPAKEPVDKNGGAD